MIEDFEYFDPLFVTMYKMYLQSPDEVGSMSGYIELTYSKLQMTIKRFVSIFVPCVYGMVAFLRHQHLLCGHFADDECRERYLKGEMYYETCIKTAEKFLRVHFNRNDLLYFRNSRDLITGGSKRHIKK